MLVSRISRLTAVLVAGAALAAPGALARPAIDTGDFSGDNAAVVDSAAVVEPEGTTAQSPIVEPHNTGIDWGSAALGGGVGAMVILLAAAGAMTYRRRHPHVPLAR